MTLSNPHAVINIPELLDKVFSFLPDSSNANNALVCKQWSELALDLIWHDVDDLFKLLRLLSPVEYCEFLVLPNADSWKVFEKYGRRVRRLRYYNLYYAHNQAIALRDVARTRPKGCELLPNLHTLMWNADPAFAYLFMHNRIKHLAFGFSDSYATVPTAITLFPQISRLMPNVTHLEIQVNDRMEVIERETLALLNALPELKCVALGPNQLTAKVAECLSKIAGLSTIKSLSDEIVARQTPFPQNLQAKAYSNPDLDSDAFLALKSLSFYALLPNAQRFLTTLPTSSKLTTLCINSPEFVQEETVKVLIACLADECPNVENLALTSRVDPGFRDTPKESDKITIHTLKLLLHNRNIASLTIVNQYPLDLYLTDIEEISLAWPSLHKLVLNPMPGILMASNLTLEALVPLAQNCSKLSHLGLYVHASSPVPPYHGTPRFKNLDTLDVGTSFVTDEDAVSKFIRQISSPELPRLEWKEATWGPRPPIIKADGFFWSMPTRDAWGTVYRLLGDGKPSFERRFQSFV